MTTIVQVPASLGGTDTPYNDGTGPYGMASQGGYGHVTYLFPMLSEVLAAGGTIVANAQAVAADRAIVTTKAAQAATSATEAATQAGIATTKADAASVSASAAATSETNAAQSEAQAAAIVLGDFLQSGAGAVARTFSAKARDIVSAFDFMTPSEIADVKSGAGTIVTTAVQNALNAGAAAVFLAGGLFTANVTASADVSLIGAGKEVTILQASGTGVALTVNADVNLSDMTIKCHATDPAARTIVHEGANMVRARNVRFYGVNHRLSAGVDAAAEYRDCETYTTDAVGLGALCHSPLAKFWNCSFLGVRATEINSSIFYDCLFGDLVECTLACHLPVGETSNGGAPSGYPGTPRFYNPRILSSVDGLTCGNAAHPYLFQPYIYVGSTGLYARTRSTHHVEGGQIISTAGNAVAYAKTADAFSIGIGGESILEGVYLEGGNKALSVPPLTGTYPASIGNVRLIDCVINGGDSKISDNTSTYHVFETRKVRYLDNISFEADGVTKRIRYKGDGMSVGVFGSDAAKTGCHLSHLDRVTGLPLPSGTRIWLYYSGVSSRFVTFATGATADAGAMYFAGGAATLATTQTGLFELVLQGTEWRQIG